MRRSEELQLNKPCATAGMLLKLLLSRYGLDDNSVLCIDSKSGPTQVGHADGLHARSLEMLATLGLEYEFVRHAREMRVLVEYRQTDAGMKRLSQDPIHFCPARFHQVNCLHQGRVEKVFLQDMQRYSQACVVYDSSVSDVVIDDGEDEQYPVKVSVEVGGKARTVRAKYVVGADGAHSVVRRALDVKMEGDVVDEVWGVIDIVPDTDLGDVRKYVRFTKDGGQLLAMIIPREKLSNGDYQIRVYIEMDSGTSEDGVELSEEELRERVRRKKAEITSDDILAKIQQLFKPYRIEMKKGTQPLWWTTYGVGQRLAEKFIVEDSKKHPRVFLVGDGRLNCFPLRTMLTFLACHTHSPRQGQGMNISMQDTYYLSWRLAYAVLGLSSNPSGLLQTYEDERRPWAQRVVTSDKRWNQGKYSWQEIVGEMREQVLGCGIEEAPSLLVSETNDAVAWQGKDLLNGTLRTGRRLLNVPVTRWADGQPMDIHDSFDSDGRYRVLVLAGKDFPQGRSGIATEQVCELTKRYEKGLVELVVVQPYDIYAEFSWDDMPAELKIQAEMTLYHADEKVYQTYGVDIEKGAVALVRPDGIVCITVDLEDVDRVDDLLSSVLVKDCPVNGSAN